MYRSPMIGGKICHQRRDDKEYQNWSRSAIEEKFATTLAAFERFLRDLPEAALENERIYLWLRIDAIDHYEDHRLPNGPALGE